MKKLGLIARSFALPLTTLSLSFALPLVTSAQVTGNVRDINGIIKFITDILDVALPIIIAAAVVYFIYGIAKFVLAGDENAKEVAKDKIIYGVIALFVMVSVWGLVNILVNTFGLDNSAKINNPIDQIPNFN